MMWLWIWFKTWTWRGLLCQVSAISCGSLLAWAALLAADREPPFTLSDGYTVPANPVAGQEYRFSWIIIPKRVRACDGTVRWNIIDKEELLWTTPPQPSLFVELEGTQPRRVVGRGRTLPSGIGSGEAKFQSSIEFVCNWTHKFWPILVNFPEVKSTVIGK